jgi:hypothetical protein
MLFAGLFRSVLADGPTHLGGVGSGVLITLQQSGLALGVATLGTVYVAVEPHGIAHAFAGVEYGQMAIIAALAIGAAALPRFTALGRHTRGRRMRHRRFGPPAPGGAGWSLAATESSSRPGTRR